MLTDALTLDADTLMRIACLVLLALALGVAGWRWLQGVDPQGWRKSTTRPRKGRRD